MASAAKVENPMGLDEGGEKRRDPTKDFSLVEKLGEGSYGAVWKAVHMKTGTTTAIKRVPVENDLDEILNEIKIMKQCRSPYIISYYGSYFKENELWIVMEYCGAGSVSDLMRITDEVLTEDQISVVVKDSLKGLVYLHSMRKIHRDIKAGNILLNDKGESKLADFGVSGQLSDTMAKRQTVIGTPFWMAPEVIQEVGYDVKADLWSLGITVIEMAEGKPPYSNIHPMRAIFMIPSRPPPKLTEPDKWSKDMNDFVAKCLTKNPEQRPTATELLKHPFINRGKTGEILMGLIKQSAEIIAKIGREEAMGMVTNSDSEDEDDEGNGSSDTGTVNAGTVVRQNKKRGDTGTTEYSTMVLNEEESGTMRVGTKSSTYVPPFLSQFKPKSEQSATNEVDLYNADGTSTVKKNPKYASYSTDELSNMLKDLDTKLEKEIEEIKHKYANEKKDLETALQKKKEEIVSRTEYICIIDLINIPV